MLKIVEYRRVSTDRQGRSGLSLDAQSASIASYAAFTHGKIVARFTDIESGKVDQRQGLEAARIAALAHDAVIVVSTLDRLSRDLHFIAGLMKEGVRFAVADMPSASEFELHIRASVAQEERRKISERTRVALAAAKARGQVLGGWRGVAPDARARAAAIAAKRSKARKHAAVHIALITELRSQGLGWDAIAKRFTRDGLTTPNGKSHWQGTQVRRLAALVA